MSNHVQLKGNPGIHFSPENFDRPFLMRALAGREAVMRYATLRAGGHESLNAFCFAFGSVITGTLDNLRLAAAAFERTNVYRSAFEEAVAALGPERIQAALAARVEEAAAGVVPFALAPERVSPEEAEHRERIDRDDTQKLATFVSSVRESLREKATNESNAIEGARGAQELFERTPHRGFFSQ